MSACFALRDEAWHRLLAIRLQHSRSTCTTRDQPASLVRPAKVSHVLRLSRTPRRTSAGPAKLAYVLRESRTSCDFCGGPARFAEVLRESRRTCEVVISDVTARKGSLSREMTGGAEVCCAGGRSISVRPERPSFPRRWEASDGGCLRVKLDARLRGHDTLPACAGMTNCPSARA